MGDRIIMSIMPIAEFEKVSWDEFLKDCLACGIKITDYNREAMYRNWSEIQLPTRSTVDSAGYDFHMPFDVCSIYKDTPRIIPTGIRCKINTGWVLMLYPRSSMGFKYGFRLNNTVGIIDSDYYNADNEGHIMASVSVNQDIKIYRGDKFCQGVFVQFGIAKEDRVTTERTGGIGSTGK